MLRISPHAARRNAPAALLPPAAADRRELLELFLLEKALHEVEGELTTGSDRVVVPLRGILRLMAAEPPAATP